MVKRVSSLAFAAVIFVLLTGMGGKGGGFERVPRVDRNFAVVVTDASGHKLEGDKFSWEGRLRFSGYMGMAEVNVPFEKIKEVTIGEKVDRKVRATVRLINGTEAVFDIDADTRCFGESGFGSFMYTMPEIKSIVFKGVQ